MSNVKTLSHLIVVGSSAGGIEALSQMVSNLPEDFPAPVVIAQHLSPESKSHLQQILSRRSTLPVKTVDGEDGVNSSPLERGTVFVVPSDRHVNITDSEIHLTQDSAGRPKPSVDLLLSSAAEVYGERLIAVILSGSGSDGTEGARIVSREGGTVVVQDPETAEFGGMPGSLAPNTVDIVSDLDRIGKILADLVMKVEIAEGEEPDGEKRELDDFLEELREQRGLDFTNYKRPTITRRLQRRMVATGIESIEEYSRYLRANPEEYRQLVNTFLIKVTEFFRDPEFFDYLGEEILPKVIEEARANGHQLRIWSAGCATGEEAYSLAILLSETLGKETGLFNVRIFATDVDEDAVNFARQGIYPGAAISGVPEERIERYFDRAGSQYRIKKSIRSMIVFGEHDLARRSPFPNIDLVMSRNVMIYFTNELQRRTLQLFAYSLRDGGYLALGKAETTSPLPGFFEQRDRNHKVYRRQGERFLMPPYVPVSPAPVPRTGQKRRLEPNRLMSPETQREMRRARITDEGVLNQLPTGMLVVDRRYDIRAINTAARQLLGIHGVAIGEDLLHLLRNVSYDEVRGAIDAAFRDGASGRTGELTVEDVASGTHRSLQLTCHPQREEDKRGLAETVVISVHDVTEIARARKNVQEELSGLQADFESFRNESETETAHFKRQNERLVEMNRKLEEANRELADLNEELQVANEESLLSTEEAQASTEEVETLNEELQATNEELETLNEELQATVEELNTTNDDLHARSTELREFAGRSEAEQTRLYSILGNLPDAILVVDDSGEPSFANRAYTETFGEDGFLPHTASGEPLEGDEHPIVRASRGEEFEIEVIATTANNDRLRFWIEGRALDGDDGAGGVLVLRRFS